MENNEVKTERAVLCGLAASSMDVSERSTDISMEELAALVETAGGETIPPAAIPSCVKLSCR